MLFEPKGEAVPAETGATIEFPAELPAVRRGDDWVARAGEIELRLTNLTKVFWPETGYTKGDLVTYYFNVALTLLPHVAHRPLTLRRTPEGVNGPYWYEKDAPAYTPDWVETLEIEAEEPGRTIRFVTVTDVASLLWVANIGCIELHPHHSRGPQQDFPTYAVFDLDPFAPATIESVKEVARLVQLSLDRLGLESYPKTSGAEGLQVYIPLDGSHHYDEVRAFVTEVSRLIHAAAPELTTLEWEIPKRAGKVFLDANMNRAGASFSAPYSVRAKWGAPVAMPFSWGDLDEVEANMFTLADATEHVLGRDDPFRPVAEGAGQSLKHALADLGMS